MTVTFQLLLLIAAIICGAIVALIGFEVLSWPDVTGWLGLTLVLGLASRLP